MKFRGTIEPSGSHMTRVVIDLDATDYNHASLLLNDVMAILMLRGMCSLMRLDGGDDKTGMVADMPWPGKGGGAYE